MALGAADGEPEPDGGGRVDAIDDRLDAELLDVDPPLLVDRCVAVEPGGDLLRERRVGPEVPRELVDGELVEGEVAVQGVDDPVAIGPDRSRGVDAVPVRVGVARQVEPWAGPSLAVV